ncbi:MAG: DUF1289 domain-containing protein [Halopseudomonas sp.]
MIFNPCTGKCTDEGSHCEGCGRTHEDVAVTRKFVKEIVGYVQKKEYENPQELMEALSRSVQFKLQQAAESGS